MAREGTKNRTVMNGSVISRHHARLQIDGPVTIIRDDESANGLFINGKRIVQAPLRIGDVISAVCTLSRAHASPVKHMTA